MQLQHILEYFETPEMQQVFKEEGSGQTYEEFVDMCKAQNDNMVAQLKHNNEVKDKLAEIDQILSNEYEQLKIENQITNKIKEQREKVLSLMT